MRKKRVLITENYKDFAELMIQFFSKQPDMEIVGVAYNGNQALTMIKQTKPDVLLLDLIMPGMDGVSVLRNIQGFDNKPKVYVISAIGNEDIYDMVNQYGVEQYFIKPLDFREVYTVISG